MQQNEMATAVEQEIYGNTKRNTVLVFDSESTGIPHFKDPSDAPHQPHLVELCGLLFTEGGALIETFEAIIKPDGWDITEEISAIHGITHAHAMDVGMSEKDAILGFLNLHGFADVRVAHNRTFDDRMIRIGIKRYLGEEAANEFKVLPAECTALLSKPVCKLPPTEAMKKTSFKNSFKTPSLSEALSHICGVEQEERHRANADAWACARVYFALKGIRMPDYPNDLDHLGAIGTDYEGGSHD